jgi:signal transduction histidine kinase
MNMKKLHLSRNLMIAAILLLAAFQGYWLLKLYTSEYNGLQKEVDVTFRETIYKLQKDRFEKDTLLTNALTNAAFTIPAQIKFTPSKKVKNESDFKPEKKQFAAATISSLDDINPALIDSLRITKSKNMPVPPPGLIEVFIKQKIHGDSGIVIRKDSTGKTTITTMTLNHKYKFDFTDKDSSASSKKTNQFIYQYKSTDSSKKSKQNKITISNLSFTGDVTNGKSSPIVKLFTRSSSINDSLPIHLVDSAYSAELKKSNKKINYNIVLKKISKDDIAKLDTAKPSKKDFITSNVLVGYTTPYSYQAKFDNVFSFIIQKMGWQISGSLLLLSFVIATFISLYRNLLAQRRLAEMKNEFISNITHELKTPIATVNVAIEALRSFGGITNPEKTKTYLDISASELQRLSLLVDKVLKLSMFENKEVELNKETFDLKILVGDVMNTMKLQFEKQEALVVFETEGDNFYITADKLHITSVIYNLLDNALKYSNQHASIKVFLKQHNQQVEFSVTDNGIGIPSAYIEKVFDKFFRVPTGNIHNTKGYGLGLSYVAHIVSKHKGTIDVKSEVNKGSVFTVYLPTNNA